MKSNREELLKEAIKLELNVGDLYRLYSERFTEDSAFWLQMAKEEAHHAGLLDLAQDFFDGFPEEIVFRNVEVLKKGNRIIEDTVERYKKQLPSKQECYQYAIDLESGAYEVHYQQLVTQSPTSKKMQTFQKINDDDKDHARRIQELLDKYS